jgi:hypothetical protein
VNIRVTPRRVVLSCCTIAILTAAAATAGLGGPPMVCLGILTALICPGAGPVTMLRPWIGVAEAAPVAVGLSVSLTALTGVLIYALGIDLSRTSLAIGLAVVTVLGSVTTLWFAPRDAGGWSISLGVARSGAVVFAVAVLLLGATAVVTVRSVDSAEAALGFTQVWAGSAAEAAEPTINIHNHEGRPERYIVRLKSDGRVISRWRPFSLGSDETWTTGIGAAPEGTRLVAVVERARSEARGRQTIRLTR